MTPSLPHRSRLAEILPTKRQNRTRSLLGACGAAVLLLLSSSVTPALAVNEPQLRQTYPRHLGSVRSISAAVLRATFDRDLAEGSSTFILKDNTTATVAGTTAFTDTSSTGGRRSITFAPAAALTELLSPYTAQVDACAALPSVPCASITYSFFIDDTAPAAPGISDPVHGDYRTDQPVLVRGAAEPGTQILIAEDMDPTNIIATSYTSTAGTYVVPMPWGPEDGVSHTIRAYARDEAGNDSPSSGDITFIHDSVTFRPIITAPFNGQVLATSTVPVAGLAKAGSMVEVSAGGPPLGVAVTAADQRWSTSITVAEGTHTITATADDGFVVDGPSNAVTFTVDLTAPGAPVITSPAAGSQVASQEVLVAGSAEPGATVRVAEGATLLAAEPVSAGGAWQAAVTLPQGPHTLSVVAVDAAGNVSPPATITFTVDTVPPVPPLIVSPAEGEVVPTSSFAVDGKAEAGALVRLYEGEELLGTDVADLSGDWLIAALFADGAHDLKASAQDAAGNLSDPSGLRHFGVDTSVPAAPQILSPVNGSFTDRAQVLVTGTAEPNSGVTVREASMPLGTATASADGSWSTRITFAAGLHTIDADATDLAGNTGPASTAVTFDVVLPATDTTPPGPPTIGLPASSSVQPGFVRVRGNAEVGSTVTIFEGSSPLGSASADSAGVFELGISFQSGSHTITARATDAAGNTSIPSTARTFSVDATRPTVSIDAPLFVPGTDIALLPLSGLSGSAADATGVVRIDLEFANKATGAPAGSTTADVCTCPGTSVTWSAAWPSPGYYRVAVYAVDVVGNRSEPAYINMITSGVTPPSP